MVLREWLYKEGEEREESMRPEELMIGDWILSGNEPVKVYCAPYSYGKGVNLYHVDNTYSPIPLTEEILEKNGLTKMEAFNGYNLMRLTSGFYSVEDHCLIEFKYVHQLQHLLRLIGLEKEIIL